MIGGLGSNDFSGDAGPPAPGGGYDPSNYINPVYQQLSGGGGAASLVPTPSNPLASLSPAAIANLIQLMGTNAPGFGLSSAQMGLQGQQNQNQYNLGLKQLDLMPLLANINQQTALQGAAINSMPGLNASFAQRQLVGELPGIFSGFSNALSGLGGIFGGGGAGGSPGGMYSNSGAGFSFGGYPAPTGASQIAQQAQPYTSGGYSSPQAMATNNYGLGQWSMSNPHAPVDLSQSDALYNGITSGNWDAINAANNSGALGGLAAQNGASLPHFSTNPVATNPLSAYTALMGGVP